MIAFNKKLRQRSESTYMFSFKMDEARKNKWEISIVSLSLFSKPKRLGLSSRVRPRFFDQVGHETMYSILPNRHVYTFISGKVCLLNLIEAKRQTMLEKNVYTC